MERRRRRRKTAWEIALETGIPASTVSQHLKQQGLGRIWRLEEELRSVAALRACRSWRSVPHRCQALRADRGGRTRDSRRSQSPRSEEWAGRWRSSASDDHTRLAYAEVLPAENAKYAVAFFRRALRWFGRLGIRCQRLLTDNAKCYAEAKAFPHAMRGRRHPAELHPSLHAQDQRQGGALHPDAKATLGLSPTVPDLRDPGRLASRLAQALQSSPTPSKPGKETAHGKTQTDPPTTCLGPTTRSGVNNILGHHS